MIKYFIEHPEIICQVMLIILTAMADIVYGVKGDYRMCCYWLAACVLNLSVTKF